MKRKIVRIDRALCNGCGACAAACHEGAIGMEDGRAKLLRDDYCDGLGDCLPACPTGAISFEEREAAPYDEAAVRARKSGGRPEARPAGPEAAPDGGEAPSRLRQWPVQLKLAPVSAPYYEDADLLIAADCTAYACAGFHQRFMRGKVTLIGCPKLDAWDYAEKLTDILRRGVIRSVSVVRMEVPCCGGMVRAVQTALERSGKALPLTVTVLSVEGTILRTEKR